MASKLQVIRAAQKINATVLDDGTELEAFAPRGFVFNATDTMALVTVYRSDNYGPTPKSEAWLSILQDLDSGLRLANDDETDALLGFGVIHAKKSHVLCLSTTHEIE
jgi:hypothetical protein